MKHKITVTNFLLVIQIVIFALNAITPFGQEIYAYFIKNNLAIAGYHQYWRLITPLFIHFGIEHLLFNSVTLYFLGAQVENQIGSIRFLILYLFSGIMGNLFSYQFSPALSGGASTALFGLFAFYIAMERMYPNHPYYKQLGQQYKILLILNIVLNLFSSGIDIAGHIGGIVGGVLMTFVLTRYRSQTKQREAWISGLIYVAIAAIILINCGYYNVLLR